MTRPVMESFYHTLKVELVYGQRYRTIKDAQIAKFDYLEIFYNRDGLEYATIGAAPLKP